MKKRLVLLLLILTIISINQLALAKMVTVYEQREEIPIYTRVGTQTTIQFVDSPIQTLTTGNDSYFTVEQVNESQITIYATPQAENTNLNVTTKDGSVYVFNLIETENKEYYSFVWAKNKPNLDIAYYINLANKKRVSIDPIVRDLVNVYNIDQNIYAVKGLDRKDNKKVAVNLSTKRAVTVQGDNVTIYWFRLRNTGSDIVNLTFESLDIEKRSVLARAVEQKKERLSKNEYVDLYLVLQGAYTQPQFTLTMQINGKQGKFELKNIPYRSQDFKVFNSNEDTYKNVTIEDYQR